MKDIKEEIREIVRGVGNQALIEKEMVIGSDIIEDKVSRLVKLFNKQLDNNTKRVKKETVEKLEEVKKAKWHIRWEGINDFVEAKARAEFNEEVTVLINSVLDDAIKAIK